MRKKYLLLILLLFVTFISACDKKSSSSTDVTPTETPIITSTETSTSKVEDTSTWEGLEALSIEILEDSIPESVEYDEFDLSTLKIVAHYDNNVPDHIISVTEDMLDSDSLAKLTKPGNPRIKITYDGLNIKVVLKLIDSSLLDKDLNIKNQYQAVIKAIRNKETSKIDFILEAGSNVDGLQIKYTFDQTIMQISNPILNENLNQNNFTCIIENGTLSVMYYQETTLNDEITLFSVDFTGNFRTSKLAIDNTFANQVWSGLENYTKVLYHVSIK